MTRKQPLVTAFAVLASVRATFSVFAAQPSAAPGDAEGSMNYLNKHGPITSVEGGRVVAVDLPGLVRSQYFLDHRR